MAAWHPSTQCLYSSANIGYRSGCGPIGLITAAVCHAYSARKIIAFDIRPSRVEFARNYKSPLTNKPIIDHVFCIDAIPAVVDEDLLAGEEEHGTIGDMKWERARKKNGRDCCASRLRGRGRGGPRYRSKWCRRCYAPWGCHQQAWGNL